VKVLATIVMLLAVLFPLSGFAVPTKPQVHVPKAPDAAGCTHCDCGGSSQCCVKSSAPAGARAPASIPRTFQGSEHQFLLIPWMQVTIEPPISKYQTLAISSTRNSQSGPPLYTRFCTFLL